MPILCKGLFTTRGGHNCVCVSHGMRRLCAVVVQSHLLPLWANSGEGWWRAMSEMSVLVTLDIFALVKTLADKQDENMNISLNYSWGPKKNHDSQSRDRILYLFLRLGFGQFSPYFGAMSLPSLTENLERKENNPLEQAQRMQWRPRFFRCILGF